MSDKNEGTKDLFAEWTTEGQGLADALSQPVETPPQSTEKTTEHVNEDGDTITETLAQTQERIDAEADTVFSEWETKGETEVVSTSKKEEVIVDATDNYTNALNFLQEKGFVKFELEEGEELTPEIYERQYQTDIQKEVDIALSELPESVKKFNNFVLDGGNPEEYLKAMIPTQDVIRVGMDLESEVNQIALATADFRELGYDDETITQQIESLKAAGKLKTIAEARYNKFKLSDEKRVKDVAEQHRINKQNAIEKIETARKETIEFFEKNTASYGVKFTPKEISSLPNYIDERSVELENGQSISPFFRDLYGAVKDPEKKALIAKILQSDFDFESIKKNITTDTVKRIKDTIDGVSTTSKTGSQKSGLKNRMNS